MINFRQLFWRSPHYLFSQRLLNLPHLPLRRVPFETKRHSCPLTAATSTTSTTSSPSDRRLPCGSVMYVVTPTLRRIPTVREEFVHFATGHTSPSIYLYKRSTFPVAVLLRQVKVNLSLLEQISRLVHVSTMQVLVLPSPIKIRVVPFKKTLLRLTGGQPLSQAQLAFDICPSSIHAPVTPAPPLSLPFHPQVDVGLGRINLSLLPYGQGEEEHKSSGGSTMKDVSFLAGADPTEFRSGTISAVQDYGLFVNIDGVDGLCHVSKLTWVSYLSLPVNKFSAFVDSPLLVRIFYFSMIYKQYRKKIPPFFCFFLYWSKLSWKNVCSIRLSVETDVHIMPQKLSKRYSTSFQYMLGLPFQVCCTWDERWTWALLPSSWRQQVRIKTVLVEALFERGIPDKFVSYMLNRRTIAIHEHASLFSNMPTHHLFCP